MTAHLLRDDTFSVEIAFLNLFLFCLDSAILLLIMQWFIKFWLGSNIYKSLLFCVLLNGYTNSFRIRDKEEPQQNTPKEHNNTNRVQKVLPLFVCSDKYTAYLDAKDVSGVIAGSPEAGKESAGLFREPATKNGYKTWPKQGIKCSNDHHDRYEIRLAVPVKWPRHSEQCEGDTKTQKCHSQYFPLIEGVADNSAHEEENWVHYEFSKIKTT